MSTSAADGVSEAAAPQRSPGVDERLVDGDLVLYNAKRQRVHLLNPTAAFIWQRCDGAHSPAAIAAALARLYRDAKASISQDVAGTLALFRAEGLLDR